MSWALFSLLALQAAAPARVAVVELAAPPSMVGLAAQITEELGSLARAQGLQVLPPDEVRRAIGDKLYAEVNDCGPAASCLAEKLGALGPQRVVSGTLGRTESAYVVELWLYEGGRRSLLATARLSVLIASRRLLTELRAAVPRLLRGEPQATGTLAVSADVPGAKATVDGTAAPPLPFELELSAGKHALRVEKPEHLAVERLVLVEPGARTEERVVLYPAPRRVDLTPGDAPAEVEVTRAPGLRVPGFSVASFVTGALAVGGGVALGMAARRTTADPARARTYALGSTAAWATGGALFVAGISVAIWQTAQREPGVQISAGGAF